MNPAPHFEECHLLHLQPVVVTEAEDHCINNLVDAGAMFQARLPPCSLWPSSAATRAHRKCLLHACHLHAALGAVEQMLMTAPAPCAVHDVYRPAAVSALDRLFLGLGRLR